MVRERDRERECVFLLNYFFLINTTMRMKRKKMFTGRGLEMSTDLTGWERWRRLLPTSDSPVNSERSGGLSFLFLLNPKSPL